MPRFLAVTALLVTGCSGVVATPSSSGGASEGHGGAPSSTASSSAATGGAGSASATSSGGATTTTSGSGGDAGAPDHDALVAILDAFCTPFAEWACDLAASCGCATAPGWPGSIASCIKVRKPECAAMIHDIEISHLTFLPERGAACVAALEASGNGGCLIDQVGAPSVGNVCPGVLAHPEALGQPCNHAAACAGGDGACVDGVCRTLVAAGQSCKFAGCLEGTFCNGSHVCQARGGPGASCATHVQCQLGLACDGHQLCSAPGPLGASCSAGDVCAAGTGCQAGICQPSPLACSNSGDCGSLSINHCAPVSPGQCLPLVPDGAPCPPGGAPCASGLCLGLISQTACLPRPGAGDPCPYGGCEAGLGCDQFVTGTCQPGPAAGQPCNVGPDAVQCAAGTVCSAPGYPEGMCVPIAGPPCQADAECPPDERCCEARVCRKPVARGDVCDAGTPCAAGHECQRGKCREIVGAGATCPDDFAACAAGLACVTGPSAGHGTCQALPTAGQECGIDERCADGLGCTGKAPFGSGQCVPYLCDTFPP